MHNKNIKYKNKLNISVSVILCIVMIFTNIFVSAKSELTNVALGKTATSDMPDSPNNRMAADLTDGIKDVHTAGAGAWYVHQNYTDTEENYIEIDLGAYYNVSSATIYSGFFDSETAGGHKLTDYTIMYHDGNSYRTIPGGDVENADHGVYEIDFTTSVITDKIKLVENMMTHYRIREIEVYGTFHSARSSNVALGKTATSDMTDSVNNRVITDLTDGVTNQYAAGEGAWYVHQNSTETEENYIEIDLGANYTINSAVIRSGSGDAVSGETLSSFTIYYYDGFSYHAIPGTENAGTAAGYQKIQFSHDVTTNKIKIVESMTTAYRIREIEVFGLLAKEILTFENVVFDVSQDGYIDVSIDVKNYMNTDTSVMIVLAAYSSDKTKVFEKINSKNIILRTGKFTLEYEDILPYNSNYLYKLFVFKGEDLITPLTPLINAVTLMSVEYEGILIESADIVYKSNDILLPAAVFYSDQSSQIISFEESDSYLLNDGYGDVLITLGETKAYAENEKITFSVSPELIDGRLYLPLEFAEKCLKRNVVVSENKISIEERAATPSDVDNTNGKKIYALYHGFRRTRDHDGDLGSWKIYYDTTNSATGVKYINYNPDLVDYEGYHQVASANGGPIVGMFSERDEDYIEYKILLAKIAGLDGFMMDYIFPEHSNTVMIEDFIKVAEKYDFEIGVDWLDSSIRWVQNYEGHDDIKTQEDLVDYSKVIFQYAWDKFYSGPTAAQFDGRPLFFFFGGGVSNEEFVEIKTADYDYPETLGEPIYVRRGQSAGRFTNGEVVWDDLSIILTRWKPVGVDVFSWIAPKYRTDRKAYLQWDKYGTLQDNIDFLDKYQEMWKTEEKNNVNVATIWPGFDNRGCADWGGGTFAVNDRMDGDLYRILWNYYVDNEELMDLIDIMFIASWSDFTEGHEIEPTVANGYREIITTQKYAAEFKGIDSEVNPDVVYLPQKLLELRKVFGKLEKIGFNISEAKLIMDIAAKAVSEQRYLIAEGLFGLAENLKTEYLSYVKRTKIKVSHEDIVIKTSTKNNDGNYVINNGLSFNVPSNIATKLKNNYYEGFINYSYYGNNNKTFTVKSDTERIATDKIGLTYGDYSVIAQITKDSSGAWEQCKTELYYDNILWDNGGNIVFSGDALIKDISMEFNLFEKL